MDLKGSKCHLRPWRLDVAEALWPLANNRKVSRNLRSRFPFPYTFEDARTFLSSVDERNDRVFCIEVDGQVAGGIGFHPPNDAIHDHVLELGYWLGEPFWGRGIATEAVSLIVKYAFKTLPIKRLEACVFSWNPASARVLEKNSFVLEGRLRESVCKDNEYCDQLVYGLLR